jgi:hypothetical protein
MAAKRDKSGAEVVMIAAEYGICTSRTHFMGEPKFVGFERLYGSRRSLITRSDDGYVGGTASGFLTERKKSIFNKKI